MTLSLVPSEESWAKALRYAFDGSTQRRAVDYVARVELGRDRAGLYVARVKGTRRVPYEMRLVPFEDLVYTACDCPLGAGLVACKHMLAMIHAIDHRCPDRGPAPSELEVTEIGDEILRELGPVRSIAQPHWRQSSAPAAVSSSSSGTAAPKSLLAATVPGSSPVATVPSSPPVPARRQRPNTQSWRERASGYFPKSFLPTEGRPAAVEYLLRARPIGDHRSLSAFPYSNNDRVRIVASTVKPSRDGTLKRKLGVDRGRTLGAVDRQLLDRLLDSHPVDAYGFTSYVAGSASNHVGVQLPASRAVEELPRLAATGRLGWVPSGHEDRDPITVLAWDGDQPYHITITMAPAGDGHAIDLRGELVRENERLGLDTVVALVSDQIAIVDRRLIVVTTSATEKWCHLLAGGLKIPATDIAAFLDHTCQHVHAPVLELGTTGWTLVEPPLAPRMVLTARGNGFDATTELRYGKVVANGGGILLVDGIRREVLRRRFDDEQRIAAIAKQLGAPVGRAGYVAGQKLRTLVENATEAGIEVWVAGKPLRASAPFRAVVSSGIDWFDVTIEVGEAGATAELPELLAAIRKDRPFLRLSDGSMVLRPKWLDHHARVLAHAAKTGDDALRFRRTEALVVEALVADAHEVDLDAGFTALRERLDRVGEVKPRSARRGFGATLRDYQREGLGWLHFLRETGFGGCLADDMGLGKTVQVLALIDATRPKKGARRLPSLVVAPRSLVFHWIDEARRFAPRLRTLEWHGGKRDTLVNRLADVDLVVTTYGTLRRDIERLAQQPFELVVLDEAQAIKRATTQVAESCRQLAAEHRLALTGTPIENRLDDLASIFDFLNPGLLGRANILRDLGVARGELEQARVLGRLLRPFMLRRTKDEVLTELPAKTEQILSCRLEGKERRRYDELRLHYREALLPAVERDGVGRSAMIVLEALLRLRQAALHPGLLDPDRIDEPSAKLETLVEQLREVIGAGHNALVFSQFTSMLAIVERRLEREKIAYEYLDGQTTDRRERVAAFQSGSAPVFLLSLKAGGTGLNLTRADHVFLLDPWWNPAVEAQAIDRVHRIGQARPVTAYRLVAENTVEAKILALQDHKRALFANVFEHEGVLARMTAADIKALLD